MKKRSEEEEWKKSIPSLTTTLTSQRVLARGIGRISGKARIPQKTRDEDDTPLDAIRHHGFCGCLREGTVRLMIPLMIGWKSRTYVRRPSGDPIRPIKSLSQSALLSKVPVKGTHTLQIILLRIHEIRWSRRPRTQKHIFRNSSVIINRIS